MTQKYDLTAKVTALVRAQQQQIDETISAAIDPLTPFQELGFDWLATIALVMEIEEQFTLIISDEQAQQFINIQSIVSYLQKVNAH